MTRPPKALLGQAQTLLRQTHVWATWHQALLASLEMRRACTRYGDFTLLTCIDSAEVIEYASPVSLRGESPTFPTRLDLSLELLFTGSAPIYMLPQHAAEVAARLQAQAEHLRQGIRRLENFADVSRESLGLGRVTGRQLVAMFRREAGSIGRWLGPVGDVLSIVARTAERVQLLHSAAVYELADWQFQPDESRIREWFHRIDDTDIGQGGPESHLVDATAIDYLASLNAALPENQVAVLLTQSRKIWEALTPEGHGLHDREVAEGLPYPDYLLKHGIPLIQPVERVLVDQLRTRDPGEGPGGAPAQRDDWLLDVGRLDAITRMRERLRSQHVPALRMGGADTTAVRELIRECQSELDRLNSLAVNVPALEGLHLQLRRDRDNDWLGRFRDKVLGADVDSLKKLVEDDLEDLLKKMTELQESLGMSFAPLLDKDLSVHQRSDVASRVRGVIQNVKDGGGPFTFKLRSEEAKAMLHEIRNVIGDARTRGGEADARDRLYEIVTRCESGVGHNTENYLLLAAIFLSADLAFEVYDVASVGLRQLQRGPPSGPSASWLRSELTYALAVGYHRWTLATFADLPDVCEAQLRRVIAFCEAARAYAEEARAHDNTAPSDYEDPRFTREIAAVLGEAREIDATIAPPDSLQLGDAPSIEIYVAWAQHAYNQWQAEGGVREGGLPDKWDWENELDKYYLNSWLYALVEQDDPRTVGTRKRLAEQFRSRFGEPDSNFADTLAWHFFKLSQPESGLDATERALHLRAAREFIQVARDKARPGRHSNRYYYMLTRKHAQAIEAAQAPS